MRICASLSGTTTCSPLSRGVAGLRSHPRGSQRHSMQYPQTNFGEFTFRNCLENQDGSRNRGYESLREESKGLRTAASCRLRGMLEGSSAIFQTVSEGLFSEVRSHAELPGTRQARLAPQINGHAAYISPSSELVRSITCALALRRHDKGKPAVRRGRKAHGPLS
jgi:hypothetical protein